MSEPSEEATRDLADENGAIIDIGRRFAAALGAGAEVRIEDFLELVPDAARPRLLHHLLTIEFALRRARGDTLSESDYLRRFPPGDEVHAALRNLSQSADLAGSPENPHSLTLPAPAPQSRSIKHFQLLSVIGQGGFGVVWRAYDSKLQRQVAVKIPRKDSVSEESLRIFLREARAVATLRHPNIVSVYEVGEADGSVFIVTDLIEGPSLKAYLRDAKMSFRQVAEFMAKAALALDHAHARGIIHRDLKPANILLDASREPHLVDFGLAKQELSQDSLSVDGRIIGTPSYMSPEQATGTHDEIDRRSDIYSMGTVLYELLTGKLPFRGEISVLLHQIATTAPTPPKALNPSIPVDLESICLKCLAKKRSDRYQSAQVLADDLHLFLAGETLRGVPVPITRRVRQWTKKNRRQVLISAGALALGGVAAWALISPEPRTPERLVELTTEPAGCQITLVAIDPHTGEPDPDTIRTLAGVTPMTSSVPPGDYLVIAVLSTDDRWFHEVIRHVPREDEKKSLLHNHFRWTEDANGLIRVPKIQATRLDDSHMVLIDEGQVRISGTKTTDSAVWTIPPYYSDVDEINEPAIRSLRKNNQALYTFTKDGAYLKLSFDSAVSLAETLGKRLPTAAEFLRLVSSEVNSSGFDAPLRQSVSFHNPEWTITQPGSPRVTQAIRDVPLPTSIGVRVTGNGAGSRVDQLFQLAESGRREAALRTVRSVRPRRSKQDFPSIGSVR